MSKKKKYFFASHAKSSAALISLIFHIILIVMAVSYVAFQVVQKEEKKFVGKEVVKKPKMRLRKPKVPVKIEKRRKQKPKLRKRLVSKKVTRKQPVFKMPEITGIARGLGNLDLSTGLGEIGFDLPEVNFFGVKKKGEKIVFLVHAGPATTTGINRKQSPKSRMTFYTIRKRLIEMVEGLPEYTLFNAAVYWQYHTTPFSTNLVLATPENKEKLKEWAAPLNPLELEETYGSGFSSIEGFWERLANTHWPDDCITNDVPPFSTKWMYNYTTSPEIRRYYKGGADYCDFQNWARACCFALEQKPDTIFILCTGYVIGQDDPGMLAEAFQNICCDLYGEDRRKYPTINVVVLNRVGRDSRAADNSLQKFMPIVDKFHGDTEFIDDIREVMTEEELESLKHLTGTL